MQTTTPIRNASRVTVEEIRQDLGLGRDRVYEMLRGHVIPNIPIGRKFLVARPAYEEWKRLAGTEQPRLVKAS